VPETEGRIQVKLGNKNRNINIVGTTPNFANVNSYQLLYGRMFTKAENAAKKRVIVLGGELPATFETDATMLIGQSLLIKGTTYKIIGIFEEKGSIGFSNTDSNAWVPLNTAQFRLTGNENLNRIGVQISPDVPMDVAIIDVERIMRREHKIIPGAKNDFSLGDRKMFLNMQADAAEIFSYLLAGIAGISLIVGGIGIMNIMLVTVTERTREIGVRKALGATKTNILLQFLVEAMILCIVGGLIGIALGATAATLLASLAGWSTPLSISAVVIAFGFSAGVGLIFGLLPARKAANLDPIEALRFE
jgi:putative ABC transport system permease protein